MKGKMKYKMDELLTFEIKFSHLPGTFLLKGDPTPPAEPFGAGCTGYDLRGRLAQLSSQLPPLPADGKFLTNNEQWYLINTLSFC